MHALIALLLFLSMVIVAYVWFFAGVVLAIAFPLVIGSLILLVFCDPLLTPGSDRRLIVAVMCVALLVAEVALFLGGLLRVMNP